MQNKVVILLHGPYSGNAYKEIFNHFHSVDYVIKQVIISTYISDKDDTERDILRFGQNYCIKAVYSKDLINPGYFNLNRQIHTVRNGLLAIDEEECLVIKLRNDQWCKAKRLYNILRRKYFENPNNSKIITTNCFTRKDRFYHPSDMLLCGWKKDLLDYYSLPIQTKTHLDCQLEMLRKLKYENEEFSHFLISPESELFKNYILAKGWQLKYTVEDSYNAIKEYMTVINTWDINLRWGKQRNAFLPSKTVILPYRFYLEPFQGAPKEKAECYSRHEFEGKEKIRDRIFLGLSHFIFDLRYKDSFKVFRKSLNWIVVRVVPKRIRRNFLKREMGKALKEFINA